MPVAPAFVPIGTFWSHFFESVCRGSPPPRQDDVLRNYLHGVFGELTEHQFRKLDTVPITVSCANCRNNTAARRQAVCDTHMGVLTGVFRAMTHVPLTAKCAPDPEGNCTITMEVETVDGVPVQPFAERLSHVELHGYPGPPVLMDRRAGMGYALPPRVAAVMAALDRPQTPRDLARTTGLQEAEVNAALDQLYVAGWISCRFGIAA